jgi:nitronate monooxygenase
MGTGQPKRECVRFLGCGEEHRVILNQLRVPIVLAPLAGGPTTPELVAAVCEAGGLGFLAAGYLEPSVLERGIADVRARTPRPFGVNVFSRPSGPADPATYAPYVDELRRWAGARDLPLGEPAFDDDHYDAKLALLVQEPVAVVSFTFGMPAPGEVDQLHAAGSEVWVTVTSAQDAAVAAAGGADVLVAQGAEAGGHRGGFEDGDGAPGWSLLPLLQLVADAGVPLVAAGGLATGPAIAAALAAGASAVQLGTAFLLCPEAGTAAAYRDALRSRREPTRLTRAFTGRTARGVVNAFMVEHDTEAVAAYPEIHHVTQPMRRAAREGGDGSLINLWAGEAYPLIRELPAAEIVRLLDAEAQAALADAAVRWPRRSGSGGQA